jgi:hypothetical protein
MQQIRNINKEDKSAEPDDNSENGPVPEVESSSSKPDQSKGNKTEGVVVCSDVNGKALETTVEKVDDISGVQATEDQKDATEGPTSVEEITSAFSAVRKGDVLKRPGCVNTARRIPERRTYTLT